MTTIPAGLGINIDPCGPEGEFENLRQIIIQISRALPKRACAAENWRTVGGIYPSHASYPSCPTLAQVPFVFVPADDGSGNVKVYLDCPTNRDPNIETGDIVIYSEDADGNALYQGGHDDPIGTSKWWEDIAGPPKGWVVVTGDAPNIETRTGEWPTDPDNKYVANMPLHPNVVCPDHGVDVAVAVDDHDLDVQISEHPFVFTSTKETGITLDASDITLDYAYVDIDCTGDVNPDHAHEFEVTGGSVEIWGNSQGVGTLYSAIGTVQGGCTSEQMDEGCGGVIDLTADVLCTTGYHTHSLSGYFYLEDPGHFHSVDMPPHDVEATISSHAALATADLDVNYLGMILIRRYNNSANATPNTALKAQQCGLI